MDFKQIAKNALNKANEIKNKTIDYSAKVLSESAFTFATKFELEQFIKKSAQTTFKNKETGEEKIYSHRVFVIFWDENSDFFKKSLINFPILAAKAFSQNINVRLAKHNIEDVNLSDYEVLTLPSIVVFENQKVLKVINWEENILKLVKSLSLDINKSINEF